MYSCMYEYCILYSYGCGNAVVRRVYSNNTALSQLVVVLIFGPLLLVGARCWPLKRGPCACERLRHEDLLLARQALRELDVELDDQVAAPLRILRQRHAFARHQLDVPGPADNKGQAFNKACRTKYLKNLSRASNVAYLTISTMGTWMRRSSSVWTSSVQPASAACSGTCAT